MEGDLKTKIKNWIECDNYLLKKQEEIKQINEKSKAVSMKKKELSQWITTYMKENQMQEHVINITDGDIRVNEQISQSPITLKHLKNLLDNYFQNKDESTKIYNYIKENREYKKIIDLKRKINN